MACNNNSPATGFQPRACLHLCNQPAWSLVPAVYAQLQKGPIKAMPVPAYVELLKGYVLSRDRNVVQSVEFVGGGDR